MISYVGLHGAENGEETSNMEKKHLPFGSHITPNKASMTKLLVYYLLFFKISAAKKKKSGRSGKGESSNGEEKKRRKQVLLIRMRSPRRRL